MRLTQRRNYRRGIVGIATLMLLLFFWYLATTLTGWINPSRFPRPDEVLKAFTFIQAEGYGNGKLHQHVLHSLKLVAMGFAVAVSVGVPLGLLMGYSRRAEAHQPCIFASTSYPSFGLDTVGHCLAGPRRWLQDSGYFCCRFCPVSHQQLLRCS